jgi:hypothetical protein
MYACEEGLITLKECNLLLGYIGDNKPDDAGCFGFLSFWWPYGELAPRIEFLNKLIDELTTE